MYNYINEHINEFIKEESPDNDFHIPVSPISIIIHDYEPFKGKFGSSSKYLEIEIIGENNQEIKSLQELVKYIFIKVK